MDPEACQHDSEMMRVLHEALDLYKTTFLVPGNQEQPVERIARHFFNRDDKILVNLKKLPNRDRLGVAAMAIICMLKENDHVCHLDYLAVNPEYRGGGIGTKFITQCVLKTMREQHKRHVTLECEDKLVNWYCKLGATRIDVLPQSVLGENSTRYSLLCFFYRESKVLDDLSSAHKLLLEIRNQFHGMGNLELIEEEDSTEEEQSKEGSKKITYRWSKSI